MSKDDNDTLIIGKENPGILFLVLRIFTGGASPSLTNYMDLLLKIPTFEGKE